MFIVITAALFVSPSCCRWSFHWQSLLPATDHRSFYHSPWSPGSLLWLLEAAGCFGSSLLPVVHKRDTCFFSVLLSGPSFYTGDGLTDPKLFLVWKTSSRLLTQRLKAPLSVFSSSLSPDLSLQRGVTLHKAILGFYEKRSAATARVWLERLVFLIAIHLSSSLQAYFTWEDVNVRLEFGPTQHCNSSFWLYIHCMCAYVWL